MPDLRSGDHLPNRRAGGLALDKGWLPRQRRGVTPQMVGRYPDYDVLESATDWDPATRRAVLARLRVGSELHFFQAAEEPVVRAFLDLLLDQDGEPRVPAVELLDQRLAAGRLDGFQYQDMPDDRDTWRLVLQGIDQAAQERAGVGFPKAPNAVQAEIVGALAGGRLRAPALSGINVRRAYSVCLRMAAAAFYSHPWAWNEIGFGGPAYPRGFMRIGPTSVREPREKRGATAEDPAAATSGEHP